MYINIFRFNYLRHEFFNSCSEVDTNLPFGNKKIV